MNGNDPVRSWYTMPLFLSAKAPNANMFAIDSLSSSLMMRWGSKFPSIGLRARYILDFLLWILGTGAGGRVLTGTCTAGSFLAWRSTSNTMAWAFHMALRCCRTRIEVLVDQFDADVRAPFEEPSLSSFEKGGDLWVAQQLVCKIDIIGPCSYQM
jgi:hypothetical protein